MKKNLSIQKELARYFLSLETGAKITSVRELGHSLNVSIGLVSESISRLEDDKSITLERRGQLGSYLTEQSISRLWNHINSEPLIIAQTLPSHRRYEGFVTGIKKTLQDQGIECYFIFIRGSIPRLKALRGNRCKIALMSQFAAEGIIGIGEIVAATFPYGSFIHDHFVFHHKDLDFEKRPKIVAIDEDSYDQSQLSRIEFENEDVVFKRITFMNIGYFLTKTKADYAVWTDEDMEPFLETTIIKKPLSPRTLNITQKKDQKAALVIRKEDKDSYLLIKKIFDVENIMKIQNAVINNELIPEY